MVLSWSHWRHYGFIVVTLSGISSPQWNQVFLVVCSCKCVEIQIRLIVLGSYAYVKSISMQESIHNDLRLRVKLYGVVYHYEFVINIFCLFGDSRAWFPEMLELDAQITILCSVVWILVFRSVLEVAHISSRRSILNVIQMSGWFVLLCHKGSPTSFCPAFINSDMFSFGSFLVLALWDEDCMLSDATYLLCIPCFYRQSMNCTLQPLTTGLVSLHVIKPFMSDTWFEVSYS